MRHVSVLLCVTCATALRNFGRGRLRAPKAMTMAADGPGPGDKKRIVVVGNGMVGQRFVELCADKLEAAGALPLAAALRCGRGAS